MFNSDIFKKKPYLQVYVAKAAINLNKKRCKLAISLMKKTFSFTHNRKHLPFETKIVKIALLPQFIHLSASVNFKK